MSYSRCEPLRVWDRLEPRPRQVDLDRVLEARVHDALWMLTRQWQLGEFHGEDTGSPILATVARRAFPVNQVRRGAASQPYAVAERPMEPLVERVPASFSSAARAQAGSYLLTLLASRLVAEPLTAAAADQVVEGVRTALVSLYPLTRLDLDPTDETHALTVARRRSAAKADRVLRALAGRAIDGVQLAQDLPDPLAWADLPGTLALAVPAAQAPTVQAALVEFRQWFRALWAVPGGAHDDAWDGERLEYEHGCTVERGAGVTLVGAPSATGRLDWYSFDVDQGSGAHGTDGTPWQVSTAIPSPAEFAGMPAPRWWQLEDGAVSLSGLRADAGDLAKLLVTDFALVYGNNWFLIPHDQQLGTLCEVGGIVVDDVFGVRTLIGPATACAGSDWDRWDLFSLSPRRPGPSVLAQHLFLPPVLPSAVEGPPLEEVVMLRDEMTNMVWAVENRVPDGLHGSRDGGQAARTFRAALDLLERSIRPTSSATTDGEEPALTYRLGTSVPGNWIPFLPVHRPSSTHEIRLQRASMPQLFPAGAPRVRPVTSILRGGMADPGARGSYPEHLEDGDAQPTPAFINEEEVPRSGVTVRSRVQRARWLGGSTVLWHGRTVTSGRGEGSSGLRFDVVVGPGEDSGTEA